GEAGGPPREKWHVHASVRAILGQRVRFEGFGLSGNIGGEVLAVDEPGHITTGSGALVISDGLYSIYRQQLRIDNGRLLFNGGPISDPALDIRALRVSSHPEMLQPGSVDQKVGVIVRGTLRAPKVSIFSDPPLPQGQATNYLLFGNAGLESSATTVGSNVNNVGQGANLPNLSAQIGGGNGEFDVGKQNVQDSSGAQTASLFIGKYLSPRLYISYGVGLYEPITVKRLIYKLSDKWTLQAESGTASSADIIYTLEH
ncbi:MAG TPA: translocation/assembly module TamB domain-containing protein, partial [Gammaproteobacteria bacterium]|nr:translocation/assembly module TamB domain-containing protein [Gammaproteobacteria bacterium]